MNRTTYAAALIVAMALCGAVTVTGSDDSAAVMTTAEDLQGQLMDTVDRMLDAADSYQLAPGVRIKRSAEDTTANATVDHRADRELDPEKYLIDRLARYAGTHVLDVDFAEMFRTSGRSFFKLHQLPRFNFGKNSFLTGFGLGFLAFGLKKLLLPIIIGAQIIKSIALAALLPTILGSVGKVVSKGVSNFASSSSHFGPGAGSDGLSDFEFKDQQSNIGLGYDTAGAADTSGSETGYQGIWTYPPDNNVNAITASYGSNNRYPLKYGQNTVSSTKLQSGNYYTKDKTEDFKVFHTIPASSHLLANYDPFYSPLLSRIDTVYKQLGYTTEPCRERLVCQMYKNPAKFAPYSNLVSAQLSRELNELRKPSSENPEILRFFKYMKAAKDGQDNKNCEMIFSSCVSQRSPDDSVPMMTTYNEINKLVQARNAKKLAESSTVAEVVKSESSTVVDVESVLTSK
ncbi:uncharacterized protein LOC112596068 isoform X2 [Melanaphis sacchari]|uniref:uncharacterized protein LOC112596068 isoform X1 n=1 Tax=Melanaphis sacchari TaxID=742174 RepID=UPI000DC15579|nr:uncharacterized protein LOC112596068 isoform X1 [Melanaphis sacchari]XP_025197342.1 uncharacterized protein LOC112596068 isoform X1 [Melanaphis sacchari]XP_025197350.1 uncharacterized protein LOC112596068 isoform X1 [Melanaphis sacchari]XP_025197358.1 uncharacterized protein LOC112596068 isoform X1 [Melanaphis sacchari]XP_025197368.1 uncharacterized protein LOC112596068 isoform X2 [Melanaphis sacchari]